MKVPRLEDVFKHRPFYKVIKSKGVLWGWRSGDVEFANGSRHLALLQFDESSGNEHWHTFILVKGTTYDVNDTGEERLLLLKALKMDSHRELFPYRYRYEGPAVHDHHGSPDEWIG